MDEIDDAAVDAALMLAIFGFDPSEDYPEYSNAALRDAYRAGYEDGRADG